MAVADRSANPGRDAAPAGEARYRLGCDIGGTFTDLSLIDTVTGAVSTHKRLTTPRNPSLAIEEGIKVLAADIPGLLGELIIVHGTTLVVNAVIERKGAPTALITTEGFRDVLEIGREGRFDQYDIWLRFPKPIVPRYMRVEVPERVHFTGRTLRPLDLGAARRAVEAAVAEGAQAIAVCLLHSYSNPEHEIAIGRLIAEIAPDVSVSLSCEVLAEVGEYERSCTTAINAYTQPATARYLADLEARLARLGFENDILITLSTGGITSIETARHFPVRIMESGPAAGAISAAHYAAAAGLDRVVAFDMGGTTAKIALVRDGQIATTDEFEVDRTYRFKRGSGIPVRVPMVDLMEIGAGGGSVARISGTGTIQVGPDSVGADPGPACYAQGGELPAVTDANVALGYLDPDYFLGGTMPLDKERAEAAIAGVSGPLGLDVASAAYGIHSVVNENMASAAKVYLAEKGEDSSRCTLFVSGGCGPVHAVDLMRRMGIGRALFPPRPGVASAFGMSVAPVSYDVSASFRVALAAFDLPAILAKYDELESEARQRLPRFVPTDEVELRRSIDLRYIGQGFQVNVPLPPAERRTPEGLREAFEEAYRQLYGRKHEDLPVELFSLRLHVHYSRAAGGERASAPAQAAAQPRSRLAFCPVTRSFRPFAIHRRAELAPGAAFEGPAIIEEADTSIVVATPDAIEVLDNGCILVTATQGGGERGQATRLFGDEFAETRNGDTP